MKWNDNGTWNKNVDDKINTASCERELKTNKEIRLLWCEPISQSGACAAVWYIIFVDDLIIKYGHM